MHLVDSSIDSGLVLHQEGLLSWAKSYWPGWLALESSLGSSSTPNKLVVNSIGICRSNITDIEPPVTINLSRNGQTLPKDLLLSRWELLLEFVANRKVVLFNSELTFSLLSFFASQHSLPPIKPGSILDLSAKSKSWLASSISNFDSVSLMA